MAEHPDDDAALLTDSIRNDPVWNGGNYGTQPRDFRMANVWFGVATIGGSRAYDKAAPTRVQANKLVADCMTSPFTADANDFLYQWDSSDDYNRATRMAKFWKGQL